MNRVVHFEIQAEKPERAAKFYREVFGWIITLNNQKALGFSWGMNGSGYLCHKVRGLESVFFQALLFRAG